MRTTTIGERARLRQAHTNHYVRAEVANPDGTWIDVTSWSESGSWGDAIDQPTGTATINFRRDASALAPINDSLAPTWGASTLNRNDAGGYAPLLNPGAGIRLTTAVTNPGVAPVSSDWKPAFLGRIDKVSWGATPIVVNASDLGGWIAKSYIQQERTYATSGPEDVEAVMAEILAAWPIVGSPALYTPVSPGWEINNTQKTVQQRKYVLDALQNDYALSIGWQCRYKFDAADAFRFTFYEIDRSATSVDSFGPSEYRDITSLDVNDDDVRNLIQGIYYDANGAKHTRTAQDTVSQAQYGVRFMEIALAPHDLIDTDDEMDRLLGAAVSDLSSPVATQEMLTLYYWPVELGDPYTFQANTDHYDDDQLLAVTQYSHSYANGEITTTMQCAGNVKGAFHAWFKLARSSSLNAVPLSMRVERHDADAVQITYRVYVADPSPTPNSGIQITATGHGVVAVSPTIDSLVYPTDAVTADLLTTAFRDFVITKPDPSLPQGQVVFTAARDNRLPVSQAVDIIQKGVYTVPTPTLTTEAEGTALDGDGEGRLHLKLGFEFNTDRFEIYATESTSDLTPPAPDLTDNMRSGIFNRHEGAIASADDWATEADISTTSGYNRRYIAIPIGPTGMRGEPFIGVVECVDTGTPPSAPPSAFTVTFDTTTDGLSRATLAWTNGDVAAAIRVWRNGIVLTRLAAGTTTLVDTGISPDRTYNYNVQHIRNGQTSEFADTDGTIGTGTSGTPTLVAPDFVLGWPRSGGDDLSGNGIVLVRITNPDPLASTQIWMNRVQTDTGTFDNIVTLDPGQTDISLDAADYGTAATDESRWFYVVATRPSYTDSAASSHAPGDFGL